MGEISKSLWEPLCGFHRFPYGRHFHTPWSRRPPHRLTARNGEEAAGSCSPARLTPNDRLHTFHVIPEGQESDHTQMPLFRSEDRHAVESLARLSYCNPFEPEFIRQQSSILGADHVPDAAVWSLQAYPQAENPVLGRLVAVAERVAEETRTRLLDRRSATGDELTLYAYVAVYVLYQRYSDDLYQAHIDRGHSRRRLGCYGRFRRDFQHFLALDGVRFPGHVDAAHLFACFFQIRRAFDLIFRHLIGASRPAAALRAAVWQSIFTHDLRRYRRSLYRRMHDVTTLVTGPSGTGKELVARAIGLSR